MPSQEHDHSSVLSIRLPDDLIQRLDRYLDWRDLHSRAKSSRNAAIRDALRIWLEDQEQLSGLSTSQTLHRQFRAAFDHLRDSEDEVPIYRMRDTLGWPRERFDAVLEQLRADGQVELRRGLPSNLSVPHLRDSYHVYGQLYLTLRWCR